MRDYRLLVHSACFCPGQRGWLLVRVRGGAVTEVWDSRARPVPVGPDTNYSVERLFGLLEQWAANVDVVQVRFDAVQHFPTFLSVDYSVGLPDDWGVTSVRGLKAER